MTAETMASCGVVLAGAVTILNCIVKSRTLKDALPFLGKATRPKVERHLRQHRALMVFFLVGYSLVIVAFVLRLPFMTDILASMIFLFAAVFIYLKVSIETRLLSGMHETLRGLLPICAKCKKIREPNGDPRDPKAWTYLEKYISAHSDAEFTHGYCPECFEAATKKIDMDEGGG
jgi:hypothetical protein